MTIAVTADAIEARAVASPAGVDPAASASLLRFITCGSVDDGKSTLIGRILYDSQSVFEDQLEILEKDSRRFGTQGDALDFALLVDGLSAEREQGITIDVAYRYFATGRRAFIVADTPGHEQYTRNMATGASTAEVAVILIDARKGILPQTRRHSFIVSMLSVRHVAVAINKMDLIGFDRAKFDEISRAYRAMAAELGFRSTTIIPLSARDGDNVASRSARTPWYDGPTLLGLLETIEVEPDERDGGAIMPVQWVSRPDLDFRGFAGTLARGTIRRGDEIIALPRGTTSRVARIVTADGDLDEAIEGQSVTLTLADEIDVSRGDVLAARADAPATSRQFTARLLWTGDRPLASGSAYVLRLGAASAEARVILHEAIDVHSFARQPATTLEMNGLALAGIKLDRPLALLPYRRNRDLGGFILIDRFTNETMAFGLVEDTHDPREAPLPHLADMPEPQPSPGLTQMLARALLPDRDPWILLAATSVLPILFVWLISVSPALTLAFAALELAQRPLVGWFLRRRARKQAGPGAPFNLDGADI